MGAALQIESEHKLEVAVSRPQNIHTDGVLVFAIVFNADGEAQTVTNWDEPIELSLTSVEDIIMVSIYTAQNKFEFMKGRGILHSCVFVPMLKLRGLASVMPGADDTNLNNANACHVTGLEIGLMPRRLPRPWDMQVEIPPISEYCVEFEKALDAVRQDTDSPRVSISFLEVVKDSLDDAPPSLKPKPKEVIEPVGNGYPNGVIANGNGVIPNSVQEKHIQDLRSQNETVRQQNADLTQRVEQLSQEVDRVRQSADKMLQNERKEVLRYREKTEELIGECTHHQAIANSAQDEWSQSKQTIQDLKDQLSEEEHRRAVLEQEVRHLVNPRSANLITSKNNY